MIVPDRVAVVLLAAGRSTRFGPIDKLASSLHGIPLGIFAARTLATFSFAVQIAVIGSQSSGYSSTGFIDVLNNLPESGQSTSLRLGVEKALTFDVDAILVALADMPMVTVPHIRALLDAYTDENSVVASLDEAPSPPAIFGRAQFDALRSVNGDRGASALITKGLLVRADPGTLIDVDTLDDWRHLEKRLSAATR